MEGKHFEEFIDLHDLMLKEKEPEIVNDPFMSEEFIQMRDHWASLNHEEIDMNDCESLKAFNSSQLSCNSCSVCSKKLQDSSATVAPLNQHHNCDSHHNAWDVPKNQEDGKINNIHHDIGRSVQVESNHVLALNLRKVATILNPIVKMTSDQLDLNLLSGKILQLHCICKCSRIPGFEKPQIKFQCPPNLLHTPTFVEEDTSKQDLSLCISYMKFTRFKHVTRTCSQLCSIKNMGNQWSNMKQLRRAIMILQPYGRYLSTVQNTEEPQGLPSLHQSLSADERISPNGKNRGETSMSQEIQKIVSQVQHTVEPMIMEPEECQLSINFQIRMDYIHVHIIPEDLSSNLSKNGLKRKRSNSLDSETDISRITDDQEEIKVYDLIFGKPQLSPLYEVKEKKKKATSRERVVFPNRFMGTPIKKKLNKHTHINKFRCPLKCFKPYIKDSSCMSEQENVLRMRAQLEIIEDNIAIAKERVDKKDELIQKHISLLHHYNAIKDVAQALIGKLADFQAKTTKEIYEKLNLELDD